MPPLLNLRNGNPVNNLIARILAFPFPFPSLITILVANIPVIVLLLSLSSYYLDFAKSRTAGFFKNPAEVETFDFIVVGGGSAGAAVVNRLSKKYTVLLLEAGGDPHIFSYFPTSALVTLNLPIIDWGYKTVPQQQACWALKNNVSQWPRGKALGGTSVQNVMIYMRGHPKDFDKWANLTGDESWNYQNVLPYFKKLEDYHGHENEDSIKYHGKNGPIHIEKLRFSPGLKYWLEAGKELGFDIINPNGFQTQGFGPMDVTMKSGRRFSTYSGYIHPILGRSNLKIYRYAQATKIHLDDEIRAYGVTYHRHGVKRFAEATKEVIISAGAVDSPKLLMLSGIGPKDHLQQIGIKPLVDLPVGQNLQDHIFTVIGPILINKPESFILDRDFSLSTLTNYLYNGSGPIGSIAGISGLALLTSSISENGYPDIYLNHVGIGVHKSFGHESDQQFGFSPGTMETYYAPHEGKDAFFVIVNIAKPKSIGQIKLKSSDPFDRPWINPNYLTHPDDVKVMLEGIKAALNIYENTTAFQKLGAVLAPNKYPGCEKYEFRSDMYWECYLRSYTLTDYHPCGTCRMGFGSSDPYAVTDSQLRVLKTTNLRVIDASVIPSITNANLNSPTIMIGERGADLILKYWQQK